MLDDLEGLLSHPGWIRLKTWAEKEWAHQIQQHTETAANNTDDVAALNKLRQVLAAKKAVELVMDWPHQQIAKAKASAQQTVTTVRGGY